MLSRNNQSTDEAMGKQHLGLALVLLALAGGIAILIVNGIILISKWDDIACSCTGRSCICFNDSGPILASLSLGSFIVFVFGTLLFIFYEPFKKLKNLFLKKKQETRS